VRFHYLATRRLTDRSYQNGSNSMQRIEHSTSCSVFTTYFEILQTFKFILLKLWWKCHRLCIIFGLVVEQFLNLIPSLILIFFGVFVNTGPEEFAWWKLILYRMSQNQRSSIFTVYNSGSVEQT